MSDQNEGTKPNDAQPLAAPYHAKYCTVCGVLKPTNDFYRGNNYYDGYRPNCKKCHRQYLDEYNRQNHDYVLKRRAYRYHINTLEKK